MSSERSPRPRRDATPDRRTHSRSTSRHSHPDKRDPERFTQIYVARLSRSTRERDLEEAFLKFGKIKEVVMKHAYAFIDFAEHDGAVQAIKQMNGKPFGSTEELCVEQSCKID